MPELDVDEEDLELNDDEAKVLRVLRDGGARLGPDMPDPDRTRVALVRLVDDNLVRWNKARRSFVVRYPGYVALDRYDAAHKEPEPLPPPPKPPRRTVPKYSAAKPFAGSERKRRQRARAALRSASTKPANGD